MLIKTSSMSRMELAQVRIENSSRIELQSTAVNASGTVSESEDFEVKSRVELEKNLAEYARIIPEEAPEVHSVVVKFSEKYRQMPPEIMYQVTAGVAQQLLPFGCCIGTILDHHEYTILLQGGKKVIVVAHQEFFVKLPEEAAVAFAQELQAAVELKMFREHGIEPELTLELIEKEFPELSIAFIYYFLKTSHAENLEEILEFLREIVRRGKVLYEYDRMVLPELLAEQQRNEQNREEPEAPEEWEPSLEDED